MALVVSDRIKESTTTTGTGTVNLAGAETGFQTFVAGVGNSNTTYYAIVDAATGAFEVGTGTVTDASPDTLSRDTILQSSNSDSAVNFGSGTKSVFCTLPADKAVFEDASGNIAIPGTIDGRDLATDGSKLDGIEASADVTDTTNVTSAGALMDSEVTNLAQVKAFDSSDYATAAQGTTADNALPKAGGAMTGAITTNSTFDGRDVATDGTKLDGIESGATADQTAAEILTAIKTVDGASSGLDADLLDSLEATSFVRSDADDTATGQLTLTSSSTYPLIINGSDNGKIVLQGSTSPYIRFQESTTNKAYIQWNGNTDSLHIANQQDSSLLRIKDAIEFSTDGTNFNSVWHGGNDGTGSGLDADLLDGNEATAFATAAQGTTADSALQNVVEDTTPQLGGDLDVNSNNINFGVSGTAFDTAGSTDVITFSDATQTFGQIYTSAFSFLGIPYNLMHITCEHPAAQDGIYLSSTNYVACRINDAEKFHVDSSGISVTGNIDVSGTVDGKNVSACIEGVVGDTTPQLGGDLDANGNDIKLDANEKIYFGDSTDPDVHSISYITSDDVLRFEANQTSGWEFEPYAGQHSFKLAEPLSAGGWNIDIEGNSTGGTITTNYSNSSNPVYFQKNGTTKISFLNTGAVRLANLDINGAYTFPTADGSANQILKTDGSGTLSFSADSGQALIAQGTVSNATSIDFNSSILTGYDQYRIELTNVQSASDAVQLRMRFGTSNSADTTAGRYAYGTRFSGRYASNHYTNQMGTAWFTAGATSSYAVVAGSFASMGTNTGETLSTTLYLSNPNSTTKYKIARTETVVYSYYPMILDNDSSPVVYNQTSALNFVNFFASSGAISATYRVYGIS